MCGTCRSRSPLLQCIQDQISGSVSSVHKNFILFTAEMTRFRPCIDLHSGSVKQIVGGTLTNSASDLRTNFVSELPTSYFAKLYRDNGLVGAHVIMLGSGNEDAARTALQEWKGGLQVGGGITDKDAASWIDCGAEKVLGLVSLPIKLFNLYIFFGNSPLELFDVV